MLRTYRVYVYVVTGLLVLFHQATIHFGQVAWWLDIWSHMQLQVFAIGVLWLVVACVLFRQKVYLIVGVAYVSCVGVWVGTVTDWQLQPATPSAVTDVFFQNVLYAQPASGHERLAQQVATYDARVVAIVEAHPLFVRTLATALQRDPVLYHQARNKSCAVFVTDDSLLVTGTEVVVSPLHDPLCVVHFAGFDLYVAHPLPPTSARMFVRQDAYFATLTELITKSAAEGRSWVVAGDLNATLYSARFRTAFSRYIDTQYYTWNWPHPATIPIDHLFGPMVGQVSVYPAVTSDHRGLGAEFLD